jgi:hypothetical protein
VQVNPLAVRFAEYTENASDGSKILGKLLARTAGEEIFTELPATSTVVTSTAHIFVSKDD